MGTPVGSKGGQKGAGEREGDGGAISPRKIVVHRGKWSTPMKKNGRQIPDRFFITSSPRVPASSAFEKESVQRIDPDRISSACQPTQRRIARNLF